MKLATAQHQFQSDGLGQVHTFDLDPNPAMAAKLQGILRDQIYTDKPLAAVREYLCNALDIHMQVGQTRPFIVKVPTNENPNWSVRDFGTGLSDTEMENVFTKYLLSTKDGSNDQIGGFGLGSKAGFAVSNQFTVNSYQNGQKTVWAAFLNETGRAAIAKVGTFDTEGEPDGLEVVIPIKQNDIYNFTSKTRESLKWFPPGSYDCANFLVDELSIERDCGEFYVLKTNQFDPRVQMGAVSYPIPRSFFTDNNLSIKSYYNIILRAGIGDCDLSPSREQLSLNIATIDWLKSALDNVLTKRAEAIKEALANAKTDWDTILTWDKIRRSPFFTEVQWPSDVKRSIDLTQGEYTLIQYIGERGGPARWERGAGSIDPIDALIVLRDVDDRILARFTNNQHRIKGLRDRKFGFHRNGNRRVYLLTQKEIDRLGSGFDIKLSELDPPLRQRVSRRGRRVFVYSDRYNPRRGDYWQIDDGEGISCEFLWLPFNGSSMVSPSEHPATHMEKLKQIGMFPKVQLVGLGKTNMDIIESDDVEATPFWDYVQGEVDDYLAGFDNLDERIQLARLRRYLLENHSLAGLRRIFSAAEEIANHLAENALSTDDLTKVLTLAQMGYLTLPKEKDYSKSREAKTLDRLMNKNPLLQVLKNHKDLTWLNEKDLEVIRNAVKQ